MLKLSEVCQTVGVTRRTLQEYCKIGLLEPTKKSMGGYWYYDDKAVATLQHILIFVEAGYERKRIKEIMDMDKPELLLEYENAIKLLQEKKEKIDGMIVTLEVLRTAASTPIKQVSFNVVPEERTTPKTVNFMEKLHLLLKQTTKLKDIGMPHLRFLTSFIMLCMLYKNGSDSEKLHNCIEQMYEYGKAYIPDEFEEPENLTDDELRDGVTDYLEEILEDQGGIEMIDKHFGVGTAKGLIETIHSYIGIAEK